MSDTDTPILPRHDVDGNRLRCASYPLVSAGPRSITMQHVKDGRVVAEWRVEVPDGPGDWVCIPFTNGVPGPAVRIDTAPGAS